MPDDVTIPPDQLGAIPDTLAMVGALPGKAFHEYVANLDARSLDAYASIMLPRETPGLLALMISAGPTTMLLRHSPAKARELAAALVAAADAAEGKAS